MILCYVHLRHFVYIYLIAGGSKASTEASAMMRGKSTKPLRLVPTRTLTSRTCELILCNAQISRSQRNKNAIRFLRWIELALRLNYPTYSLVWIFWVFVRYSHFCSGACGVNFFRSVNSAREGEPNVVS